MIEYSRRNLDWLQSGYRKPVTVNLEVADATSHSWHPFDAIAAETYLGPPMTRNIPDNDLKTIVQAVNTIHEKFLRNIGRQIKPGTRLCLAVPAWRRGGGYKHLPCLEKLPSLGYNWVEFEHVDQHKLLYDRSGQFVARQLVVITKS